MDGVISDAREDVGQVGLRIDAVHPACFDKGVHAGRTLSACVGATEEIVLPAEDRTSHAALGGIVSHLETAVDDVAGQRRPARQGIADRLCQRAFAAHLAQRGVEEQLQLLQQRLGVFLAHGGTLLG